MSFFVNIFYIVLQILDCSPKLFGGLRRRAVASFEKAVKRPIILKKFGSGSFEADKRRIAGSNTNYIIERTSEKAPFPEPIGSLPDSIELINIIFPHLTKCGLTEVLGERTRFRVRELTVFL